MHPGVKASDSKRRFPLPFPRLTHLGLGLIPPVPRPTLLSGGAADEELGP